LARLAPCKVVFEASGSSEWLIDLLRPLAREGVLAHPGRLRIISQTVKKTDKIDAAILAELLAKDYIPRATIASAAANETRKDLEQSGTKPVSSPPEPDALQGRAADGQADPLTRPGGIEYFSCRRPTGATTNRWLKEAAA
jgi:hypothetical protein